MHLFETQIAPFLATLVRVAAWAFTVPVIGDRTVPARLRLVAAVLIAFALSPAREAIDYPTLYHTAPFEILFGLFAGSASRLALAGAEAGGQLIGLQLGLGFAGTFDPNAQEESLPTRRIAAALGGLAFLEVGGIESAIRVLGVPLLIKDSSLRGALSALIGQGNLVLVLAVRLVAPLLLATFVANLAMAIASRAAPALNVFSASLALLPIVGISVLFVTAPAFVRELQSIAALASDAFPRMMVKP